MTDRDLMQQALEALEYPGPSWPEARQSIAAALRERLADNTIHSCSYYCDRPDCVKAQRDELREKLAQPYCDDCGGTDPECPLAQPPLPAK